MVNYTSPWIFSMSWILNYLKDTGSRAVVNTDSLMRMLIVAFYSDLKVRCLKLMKALIHTRKYAVRLKIQDRLKAKLLCGLLRRFNSNLLYLYLQHSWHLHGLIFQQQDTTTDCMHSQSSFINPCIWPRSSLRDDYVLAVMVPSRRVAARSCINNYCQDRDAWMCP